MIDAFTLDGSDMLKQQAADFLLAAGTAKSPEDATQCAETLWQHDTSGKMAAAQDGGSRLERIRSLPPDVRRAGHEVLRLVAWHADQSDIYAAEREIAVAEALGATNLEAPARWALSGLVRACRLYGEAAYRQTNVPGTVDNELKMAIKVVGSTLEVDE